MPDVVQPHDDAASPNPWVTIRRQSISDVRAEIHDSELPPETKDALTQLMSQTSAATNGAKDRLLETANLCGDIAIAFTRFIVRDSRANSCPTDCAVSKVMEQSGLLTRDADGHLVPTDKMKEAFQAPEPIKKTVVAAVSAFVSKNPTAAVVFILYFADMALRNPDKLVTFFKVISIGAQIGGN